MHGTRDSIHFGRSRAPFEPRRSEARRCDSITGVNRCQNERFYFPRRLRADGASPCALDSFFKKCCHLVVFCWKCGVTGAHETHGRDAFVLFTYVCLLFLLVLNTDIKKNYNNKTIFFFFLTAGCGHTIQAFPHSHRTTNRSQVCGRAPTLPKCLHIATNCLSAVFFCYLSGILTDFPPPSSFKAFSVGGGR